MRGRIPAAVVLLSLVTTACGDDSATTTTTSPPAAETTVFGEGAFAYSASSNPAVGAERLLVAVSNEQGARLPSPDIPIELVVWLEGREFEQQRLATEFMWAIPDVSGLYRTTVEFDAAGTWYVGVLTPDGGQLPSFALTVYEEPFTPSVGDPAPPSETLTLDDAPLEALTSDADPDPAFYELSVAEAVTSGRPSVIVFATPRFCTTGVCQPTMELIRILAPQYPEVNFLHVEVFTNLDDPENLQLAPGVEEWGIPTEPWVFVVGADGIVTGRFEGLVTPEELADLLG